MGGGVCARTSSFIAGLECDAGGETLRVSVNREPASNQSGIVQNPWAAASACAFAGFVVFQFWGNAVRGYIDTASVFWWWGWQWFNPGSEAEHGPLLVALAAWLTWRNLRQGGEGKGVREREQGAGAGGDEANGRGRPFSGQAVDRGALENGRPRPFALEGVWPAVVAMVGALGLHALGFVVQQTRVSIVAVLLFAWGVMRLGGGRRWGRATVFPLGLLLFAIPLGVLDEVGFQLRLGVIATTELIAHAAGIEVVRNGTQLFAPDGGYQYDVAAACSGVRSLLALLALSALIGYLWLRSPWRRVTVFLLAFPLTFVGNVVRISAVVFAGEWLGQRAGEIVHDYAGFMVFVVVLGGVLAVSTWLAKREPSPGALILAPTEHDALPEGGGFEGSPLREQRDLAAGTSRSVPALPRRATGHRTWRAAAVVGLAAAGTVGLLGRVEQWAVRAQAGIPLAADGINPAPLPTFLGTEWIGRETEVTQIERETLPPDTGYSRRLYVAVADRREQVLISIVLSGQDRTSIHRPEICLVGQGWSIGEREEARFAGPAGREVPAALLRLEREVARRDGGRATVPALFAYWFVGHERVATTTAERLWLTALNRLRLQPDRWAYVVAQTVQLGDETEADAQARMAEVVGYLLPQLTPSGSSER